MQFRVLLQFRSLASLAFGHCFIKPQISASEIQSFNGFWGSELKWLWSFWFFVDWELQIPTRFYTLIYNTLYTFSAFYPLSLTKRILNLTQLKDKCSPLGLSSCAKRLCQEDLTYLLHWRSLCGFREGLLALQAIVQILGRWAQRQVVRPSKTPVASSTFRCMSLNDV